MYAIAKIRYIFPIKNVPLLRDDIYIAVPPCISAWENKKRMIPKGRKVPRYHPTNLESDQLTASVTAATPVRPTVWFSLTVQERTSHCITCRFTPTTGSLRRISAVLLFSINTFIVGICCAVDVNYTKFSRNVKAGRMYFYKIPDVKPLTDGTYKIPCS